MSVGVGAPLQENWSLMEAYRWAVMFHVLTIQLTLEFPVSKAKQVVVGNDMGWTNYDKQRLQVPDYVSWAAAQRVVVGDQIVFKYVKGKHDVNLLPNEAAYESCDFSKAKLLDDGASGLFVWNAERAGLFYFGCNNSVEVEEGNDCAGSGQKLALLVGASSPGGPAAPPPQNSRSAATRPSLRRTEVILALLSALLLYLLQSYSLL